MDNQTISADDSVNKIYIFPDDLFTGIQHYMHTIPDISCFAVIAFGKVGMNKGEILIRQQRGRNKEFKGG